MMKTFRPVSRAAIALAVVALLAAPGALADDGSLATSLAAIRTVATRSNSEALARLQALQTSLPADAGYPVRRDILKISARLLTNAGKLEAAYIAEETLLQQATAANDTDTASIARLYKVNKLLDYSKPSEALVELTAQQAAIGKNASRELQWVYNFSAGRTYNSLSKFEQALQHTLKALELSELQGDNAADARMTSQALISRLYTNMKNPEKALRTADAALAENIANKTTRPVASLTFTRAVALNAMGRTSEALLAFRNALRISVDSGFAGLEAQVRGNIADLYLREHDYVAAEREARAALVTSELVNDETSTLMAKANIGFALGGQGKSAEAMYYINEVTRSLRDAGSLADLEGMLDETSHMLEKSSLFQQALATVREQQQVQKQIFKTDRERVVASLQERFDAGQREKQIELLGRENQLKDADIRNRRLQLTVTLMGAAMTLVAGAFIALLYRRVRKNNLRLQDLNTQLEFHAMRDPLTGLFNRRSFVGKMQARADALQHERRGRAPTAGGLVLMDVDHFKHINDTWGHTVGDGVLVEIAARLNRTVRDTDMALRWGGEEFLIYAPDTEGDLLRTMVERLLHSVCVEPVLVGELSIPVTLTAGFVGLPFSGMTEAQCGWERAIQLADLALYAGKQNGRNLAIGLVRMTAPWEDAMAAIEDDLMAASMHGLVELAEVPGPCAQGVPELAAA
jgi:diguanylate cyclase (GGDEF)-like protein